MIPERGLARGASAAAGFEDERGKDHAVLQLRPGRRFEADKARLARRWSS
jgi:hypothetical protein